jgi:UDP-N-acetylglucosamine 4,6-dehydratase
MNIMDVAKVVAPECRTEVIGIRPGEKLHEALITSDDAFHTVEFDDSYVIQPNDVWWDRASYLKTTGGQPVAEGFQYSSDTNPVWMSGEALTALLKKEAIEL